MASEDVTRLLKEWSGGSREAIDRLTPLVYEELRRLAANYMRNESAADTLQPTALVHEAYLRLVAQNLPDWDSRSHFFGVAAHLIRQILVDHARHHKSAKRGRGAAMEPFNEALSFAPARSTQIIALDDAMEGLGKLNPSQCKIIELRFFGGFTIDETARAMGVSTATISREQRLAEAWLHRELSREAAG